ncbi:MULTISPECIES: transposase family protein [unclassified Streptomyces]|uniref:transposase family protein n=1 Tax=unclassified Streptomyces TaxID=2593676 RepID=UPI000DB97067|nr:MULTISPECIES: transposase family protein [unclassified Streptomyces]
MQCTTVGAACPGCGAWPTRVHSSYLRFPADAPSVGRKVMLRSRARRFRCRDTVCARRTFVEQIPGLTRRYGQRTERLRSAPSGGAARRAGRGRRPGVFGGPPGDHAVCPLFVAFSGSRSTRLAGPARGCRHLSRRRYR